MNIRSGKEIHLSMWLRFIKKCVHIVALHLALRRNTDSPLLPILLLVLDQIEVSQHQPILGPEKVGHLVPRLDMARILKT